MEAIHLSCRCGAVHLQISAEPLAQFYCHCDDCRAVTGGAFAPIALLPADAVTVIGTDTTTWTYKTLPRTRCSTCGTLLFGEPPGMGMRGVMGYLLPANLFQPEFHARCDHAMVAAKDDLPHFRDLPSRFGGSDEIADW